MQTVQLMAVQEVLEYTYRLVQLQQQSCTALMGHGWHLLPGETSDKLKGASTSGRNGYRGMGITKSDGGAGGAALRGSLLVSSATSPASTSSACQGTVTGFTYSISFSISTSISKAGGQS